MMLPSMIEYYYPAGLIRFEDAAVCWILDAILIHIIVSFLLSRVLAARLLTICCSPGHLPDYPSYIGCIDPITL